MITSPLSTDLRNAKSSRMESVGKSSDFKQTFNKAVEQDAKPIEKRKADEQPKNIDQPPSKADSPDNENQPLKESDASKDNANEMPEENTDNALPEEGIIAAAQAMVQNALNQAVQLQEGAASQEPVQDPLVQAPVVEQSTAATQPVEQNVAPKIKIDANFVESAIGEMDQLLENAKSTLTEVNKSQAIASESKITSEATGEFAMQPEAVLANSATSSQSETSASSDGNELFSQQMNMPVHNAQPRADMPVAVVEPTVVDMTASKQEIQTKIIESVENAIKQNSQELTINFRPEVLGGMTVKLSMAADGLHAQLIANTKDATNMIRSELVALQDSFRERGIPVAQLEVSIDQQAAGDLSRQPFFGQFHQGRGGQSSNFSGGNGRHHNSPQTIDNDAIIDSTYVQNSYYASDSENGSDFFA